MHPRWYCYFCPAESCLRPWICIAFCSVLFTILRNGRSLLLFHVCLFCGQFIERIWINVSTTVSSALRKALLFGRGDGSSPKRWINSDDPPQKQQWGGSKTWCDNCRSKVCINLELFATLDLQTSLLYEQTLLSPIMLISMCIPLFSVYLSSHAISSSISHLDGYQRWDFGIYVGLQSEDSGGEFMERYGLERRRNLSRYS